MLRRPQPERLRLLVIRPATPEDLHPLADLVDRAIRIGNATDYSARDLLGVLADYTLPALERRLARAHLFIVAQVLSPDGEPAALAGTLIAMRVRRAGAPDAATIEGLFVDPPHQGMGIGQALLGHLVDRAEQRGISRIGVAASLTAEGFYSHQGFTRIGLGRSHANVATVLMERVVA